jgi:DNA-binding beta-propeller fold protein YncE
VSTAISTATVPSTPAPTLLATSASVATSAPAAASTSQVDTQLRRPEGIVLDHDGNLWVADYGSDRVVKLGPDGHVLLSFGSHGSAPGQFVGPKGVAIDPTSGRLYVADTGNARVQRLAPDGSAEAAWPMP